MRGIGRFIVKAVITGLLVLVPLYLALLLLLKVVKSLKGLVKPLTFLVPDGWPAETVLAVLLLLAGSFVVGFIAMSAPSRRLYRAFEDALLNKVPGYQVFRRITSRMAGKEEAIDWQPALIEIEDALVPGFIVEVLDDGRNTVFVPSIPTPLAGAVYILPAARVHRVDVPFAQAIKTVSRWGTGAKDLVAAMQPPAGSR